MKNILIKINSTLLTISLVNKQENKNLNNTNIIDTKELLFSTSYIKENIELVSSFLNTIILKNQCLLIWCNIVCPEFYITIYLFISIYTKYYIYIIKYIRSYWFLLSISDIYISGWLFACQIYISEYVILKENQITFGYSFISVKHSCLNVFEKSYYNIFKFMNILLWVSRT